MSLCLYVVERLGAEGGRGMEKGRGLDGGGGILMMGRVCRV